MSTKKLHDLTQELQELYPELDAEESGKVLEAFSQLKSIQKSALPSQKFKTTLKEKLQTVHSL